MNVVKLDCESALKRFKAATKDILENHKNIKDFIMIVIEKDNNVRARSTDDVLPLVTTMTHMRDLMINKELTEQRYTFVDNKFIKLDDES